MLQQKFIMGDGTELIIKENRSGSIDVILVNASVGIMPIASNHFTIIKVNKVVPEFTKNKLKKAGIE